MAKKTRKLKKGVIVLIFLILLCLIFAIIYFAFGNKIRNIYVIDNNILSDQEIINLAKLENYPNFYTTFSSKIKKNIMKNDYIKDVRIRKGFLSVYIYVSEYKVLFIREDNNTVVLENKKEIPYNKEIIDAPILINYVPDTKYDEFIKKYLRLDDEVTSKISEIKYDPNEYDSDRFLLYMNDQNSVYVTITKLELLNKYLDAVQKFNGKKGILYLDSGNYFEIKE